MEIWFVVILQLRSAPNGKLASGSNGLQALHHFGAGWFRGLEQSGACLPENREQTQRPSIPV